MHRGQCTPVVRYLVKYRRILFKCRDLAVDRDLMEKRLAVHCEWLRQASLVTLALESFEKTLPNLERMGTFLEATQ
jgi:hypothetical protein